MYGTRMVHIYYHVHCRYVHIHGQSSNVSSGDSRTATDGSVDVRVFYTPAKIRRRSRHHYHVII